MGEGKIVFGIENVEMKRGSEDWTLDDDGGVLRGSQNSPVCRSARRESRG